MSSLLPEIAKLPADEAIFDGEVVVLDDRGLSHFQLLQNAFKAGHDRELRYCLFDLLYFDGEDLRPLPLIERKERLSQLLKRRSNGVLSYFGPRGGPRQRSFSTKLAERVWRALSANAAIGLIIPGAAWTG